MSALVIGYGNPLRSDDGAGWHAAGLLAEDPRAASVSVLRRHQLTPELAEDISRCDLVVFVDAADGGPPGVVAVERVAPAGRASAWTHHLDPAGLLALATELYGAAPPAALVRVAAGDLSPATCLSPPVAAAMAEVVATVLDLLAGD